MAARLARIRQLVDKLETLCSENAEQRDILLKLKREMESLNVITTHHPR